MGKLEIYADDEGKFELPSVCICCGDSAGLDREEQTFSTSSPLQFLAVGAWLIFAFSSKTGGMLLGVLAVSGVIVYAASRRYTLTVSRCESCQLQYRHLKFLRVVFFFLGFFLAFTPIMFHFYPGSKYVAILGALIVLSSLVMSWFAAYKYGIRILKGNSQVVKFRIPLKTSISDPGL